MRGNKAYRWIWLMLNGPEGVAMSKHLLVAYVNMGPQRGGRQMFAVCSTFFEIVLFAAPPHFEHLTPIHPAFHKTIVSTLPVIFNRGTCCKSGMVPHFAHFAHSSDAKVARQKAQQSQPARRNNSKSHNLKWSRSQYRQFVPHRWKNRAIKQTIVRSIIVDELVAFFRFCSCPFANCTPLELNFW